MLIPYRTERKRKRKIKSTKKKLQCILIASIDSVSKGDSVLRHMV